MEPSSRFADVSALQERADRRARQQRRRRLLIGCAVVVGLLGVLLARADYRGLGIAYWQFRAQPCGKLDVNWGEGMVVGDSTGDAQAVTTCFGQAYARCHAATLVETFGSFDQSWTYTYLIEPQLFATASAAHMCSLAVAQEHLPGPPGLPWQACADVAQRWYGLHFYGCGTYGDLFVSVAPLSESPPGVACGDIHVQVRPVVRSVPPTMSPPTAVDSTAPAVVACFVHAQQTCQPAWAATTLTSAAPALDSSGAVPLVQQRHLLLVEPYRQTCAVLELHWSTYTTQTRYMPPSVCSAPVSDEHGLHVAHCASGDSLIELPICGPDGMVTLLIAFQATIPCASVPPAGQ